MRIYIHKPDTSQRINGVYPPDYASLDGCAIEVSFLYDHSKDFLTGQYKVNVYHTRGRTNGAVISKSFVHSDGLKDKLQEAQKEAFAFLSDL
jgi:hypothetical protein